MKDSMIYLHLLRIIVVATIVVDGGLNSGLQVVLMRCLLFYM